MSRPPTRALAKNSRKNFMRRFLLGPISSGPSRRIRPFAAALVPSRRPRPLSQIHRPSGSTINGSRQSQNARANAYPLGPEQQVCSAVNPQHSLALLDVRRVLGRGRRGLWCGRRGLGHGRRGLGRAVFDVPLLLPTVDSLAARVLTFFLGIPACVPPILTLVA